MKIPQMVEDEIYKKYLAANNTFVGSKPMLPDKPSFPSNFKKYSKSNLYLAASWNYILIIVLFLLIIGILSVWIFLLQEIELSYLIATTILFTIISVFILNEIKSLLSRLKEIQRSFTYIDREKIYQTTYPELNEKYLVALDKYKRDCLTYDSSIRNIQEKFKKYKKTKRYQKEFHELVNLKNQALNKEVFTCRNLFMPTRKMIQKGMSENYFKRYLVNYFGNEFIFTDLSLMDFVPDFLLKISKLNFYLDIEIDEPYIGTTKEVIHYVNKDSSSDDERNKIFLFNKIPVIRFSEHQIVCYPDSCCKKIYSFISFFIPNPFENKFQSIPDLIEEPVWDYTLGSKMAREDYRDTYLFRDGFLLL